MSIASRAAIVLLTVQIATVSLLKYLTENGGAPPPILGNAFANPFLVVHVIAGVIALVIGPLQFVRRIRERRPMVHRATGMVYVAATIVSAPAGLVLALGTTAGPVAGSGFALLALLVSLFTFLGLRAALEGRFSDHREWMLRSYAMTAAAITLRLMLPASAFLGFEFLPAYRVIAWLSWMTNLGIVELYIRRARGSATRYPLLAAA